MTDGVFLESARWKHGPMICTQTNLPALATLKDLLAFIAANGPGCYVSKVWQCECGHWHAATSPRDPSGDSSGVGRSHRHDEP